MVLAPPRERLTTAGPARPSRRLAGHLVDLLASMPALGALVVWRLQVRHVNVSHLDSYGLPPALPHAWYAALLVAVAGACLSLSARRFNGWIFALYAFAIVAILYGTVPAISAEPHYSWVYKHLGVTRLLADRGGVDVSIDIYNRWPGFFALAAGLSSVAGSHDPVAFARWAEPFFTLVDAVLIAVIVRTITREARVAAGAVLLAVVGNWVGQDYYSPQALAFTLGLALLAVVTRQLAGGDGWGAARIAALAERIAKTPQQAAVALPPTWPRWVALSATLALDAVVVGSHQLTPYVLLVQMLLLMFAGLLTTRWFIAVMALMTFAYLAPNLGYIEHNFGLFTSFDPFNNLQNGSLYGQSQQAGRVFSAHAGQLLSASIWLGGALATVLLFRRGLLRRALPLLLFAASPFTVIFGQNYGGEASLRMVLFSLPWCAALISWALCTTRPRWLGRGAALAVAIAMTALFIPAFMGSEELNIMPADEVQASNWFYAHAPRGSVLMQAGPDFPARYGPNYRFVSGPQSDDDPNLLRTQLFRDRPLGAADIADVISVIHQYARRGYLVFASTSTEFAKVFRLTPPGALAQLEEAVARSPFFRLMYGNRDARIYELLDNGTTPVAQATGPKRFDLGKWGVTSRLFRKNLPVW